ncbi:MAG: calcium-binding protein [Pseudomonadota bacterium]
MAYNLSGYTIVNGTPADETIIGGNAKEAIYGNGGADTLGGGRGADLLVGGGSGTTFLYNVDATWGSGYTAVNTGDAGSPGPGTTFSLAGYGRSYDVFVGTGTNNTLVMPDGKNALFLDDGLSPGVDATRLYNIQTIQAGNGGQIIDLTSSRVTYGDVTIRGGTGADVLMANAGNDVIEGGDGNDYLWGGSGNDRLEGGAGTDTLLGAAGDDILDGGAGADAMTGGAGNDTYYVDHVGDTVSEAAGAGIDHVHSSIAYTLGANLENLTLTGSAMIDAIGNALDNKIVGSAGANLIDGGAGNDQINAGSGNDTVIGGDGNDKLFGEDSNDVMYGGAGNDALNGGAGSDTMYGGLGNDGFFGGGGNDVIYGEDGDDQIYGDGGNDVIYGGAGNDLLVGGQFKGGFSLGNDTFAWARVDVVTASGSSAGFDRIVDFAVGDRIDFSGLFTGMPIADVHDVVRLTDTAAGTVVSTSFDGGASFLDVVQIDGLHDLDLDQMIAGGSLVV